MQHLIMPLSDAEEAIVELLRQIENLKYENHLLKQEIIQLKWTLEEKD
jgi:hypothetical protein